MNFHESEYVALIAITFGLWLALRPFERATQFLLLVASFVFYGFHQWQLVFLLGAYCLVDWACGNVIAATSYRRSALAAGVGFNLAALAYWKYTPLLVNSVIWLAGDEVPATAVVDVSEWYLPIGISFYAFTGIAYLVDVYRGDAAAERDPLRFALYISFFPQLVAGPILRAREFLVHLQADAMPRSTSAVGEALFLMARGSFKKLVIADGIGRSIDPFFAHVGDGSTDGVWSLPFLYLYSLQIFFDFSGYTDVARGGGLLFGFRWPENFNRPYLASSVRDFWRRWHMTLSRFLRDYLYIPLGGGRHGAARAYCAIMMTMLLGGLWHGAAWSFMIWGGLHGAYLVCHRIWRGSRAAAWIDSGAGALRWPFHALSVAATFTLVTATWSFFRVTDLSDSLACVKKLVVFESGKMFAGGAGDVALWVLIAAYVAIAASAQPVSRHFGADGEGSALAVAARGAYWGATAALFTLAYVLSAPGRGEPFIYFRF